MLLSLSAAILPTVSALPNNETPLLPMTKRQRNKRKSTIASSSPRTTILPITPRGGGGGGGGTSSAVMDGLKNSLASGMAAACSKTLLAPFDTIKTVQQKYSNSGEALGFLDAVSVIVQRKKGFWELYSGLGVSALGSMPSVGLYFGVYSYCKRTFVPFFQSTYGSDRCDDDDTKPIFSDSVLRTMSIALSAAVGNTVASFSRVPFEVVKQKLQSGLHSSTLDAVTSMIRNEGFQSFFPTGGVSIQMVRDIPYAIFTLLSYEYLRDNWVNKSDKPSPWRDMAAGAMAGGLGSYLTNPMDVIKTRLQTDTMGLYGGSIMECARATFAEGGFRAFLRGSVPRLMHKIPANGAFFVFYELFRRLLHVEDTKQSKTKEEK